MIMKHNNKILQILAQGTNGESMTRGGRTSNFELLRILAMLGIISYHIVVHSMIGQLALSPSDGNHFNYPCFYKSMLIPVAFSPLGQLGNALFILLSGYFTCSDVKKLDLVKISKKLLTQLAFASITLLVGPHVVHIFIPDEYTRIMNEGIFNSYFWFVGYYFILIVIAEFFLKRFLKKLDQKEYIVFLTVFFGLISFSFTGNMLDSLVINGRVLGIGIFLYALGGFLSKYRPLENLKTWVFIAAIVIMYAVVFLSYYNELEMKIEDYYIMDAGFEQFVPAYSNYDPVIIILSVAVFELFHRLPEFHSKIVNYLASTTLMAYLIHDNVFFYSLWDMQDWNLMLRDDKVAFFEAFGGWTIGVFVISALVYTGYLGVCKWFGLTYNKGLLGKSPATHSETEV